MKRRLKIGISSCLLGESVRYDGGHKYNSTLVETGLQNVDWISICPEGGAGLGTPREPMHLEKMGSDVRLIGNSSSKDYTEALKKFALSRIEKLMGENISGFVFKKNSPSCGVYGDQGQGLFAKMLMEKMPTLPVEQEDRLENLSIREEFFRKCIEHL